MTTYLLEHIPDLTWRKVKSKAALEGRTMRSVILELLANYIEETHANPLPDSETLTPDSTPKSTDDL